MYRGNKGGERPGTGGVHCFVLLFLFLRPRPRCNCERVDQEDSVVDSARVVSVEEERNLTIIIGKIAPMAITVTFRDAKRNLWQS